jgi:transcriptional regulator with XRE-family HTH domain
MGARKEKVSAELVNEHFGRSLATIRKARSVSQKELGKIVGLSRGSISNLESGIQNVQLHQVFSFALALDAPAVDFIPLLRDVVMYTDDSESSDLRFLQFAKRQLIDFNASGDDDENT